MLYLSVEEFGAPIRHMSLYKSGEELRGKRVLVMGCGNSRVEVCVTCVLSSETQ